MTTNNDEGDEDREWEILHRKLWTFELWWERPEMEQALWDIEAEEKPDS